MKCEDFIFAKSISDIQEKRNIKERELDIRINKAYAIEPQLRELKIRLNNIWFNVVKAFNDKSQVLELKKQANEIELEIQKILKKHNLSDNLFELEHFCDKCKDKGLIEGQRTCECLQNKIMFYSVKEYNKEIEFNKTFKEFDLERVSVEMKSKITKNYKICSNFALKFNTNIKSMFMIGKSGKGKTHLTLAIAKYLLSKEYSVLVFKAFSLKNKIDSVRFKNEEYQYLLDIIKSCDLLIIDDLSLSNINDFFKDNLNYIIESRIAKNKPFIINTNNDTKKLFDLYGDSFMNKIKENTIILDFKE